MTYSEKMLEQIQAGQMPAAQQSFTEALAKDSVMIWSLV